MSTGHSNAISDQTGGNRYTRLIFFVCATICVVWDNGCDPVSGSTFQRINHNQQFHNGAVDRHAERLNNKYIASAHIIIDLYKNIFIAELKNICVSQWYAQMFADRSRQRAVCISCKDTQIVHSLLRFLSISHSKGLCKLACLLNETTLFLMYLLTRVWYNSNAILFALL